MSMKRSATLLAAALILGAAPVLEMASQPAWAQSASRQARTKKAKPPPREAAAIRRPAAPARPAPAAAGPTDDPATRGGGGGY
jgi:hypothetical protein